LAFLLAAAGRPPLNPGREIVARHVHASAVRTYSIDDRVPGPYLPLGVDR
jgi:hypothetical protein